MAGCTRNRVVNRKTRIVEKGESKSNLCRICRQFMIYRPDRLSSTFLRKVVVIHRHPFFPHPVKNYCPLFLCQRASPMHQIILRHRHTVIQDDFFDLCQINSAYRLVKPDLFHHGSHVEGTISRIDILHHHLACHRQLCIERQLRIRTMATQASSVFKDCINPLILREFSRRNTVHSLIDHEHCGHRYQQCCRTPFVTLFHKTESLKSACLHTRLQI